MARYQKQGLVVFPLSLHPLLYGNTGDRKSVATTSNFLKTVWTATCTLFVFIFHCVFLSTLPFVSPTSFQSSFVDGPVDKLCGQIRSCKGRIFLYINTQFVMNLSAPGQSSASSSSSSLHFQRCGDFLWQQESYGIDVGIPWDWCRNHMGLM